MKLTLSELVNVFKIVITYFKEHGVKNVFFASEDYYPYILRKNLNFDDINFRCPHYGLGSLDFDFEIWKGILSDDEGIYQIDAENIKRIGAILTAFGQVSDKLQNPAFIKNPGKDLQSPPILLTVDELQKIFDLTVESLRKWYGSPDIFFGDPRYVKIALKDEYLSMDCPPYTVESLDEAIQLWKEILSGSIKPSALAIEKLGDILTAFGEELG